MTPAMPAAHYRVQVPISESSSDVLGIWQTLPGGLALALDAKPDGPLVWCVQLPDDPPVATASLSHQNAALLAVNRQLVQADQRLEHFLYEASRRQSGHALAIDFMQQARPNPEQELAANLELLREADSFSMGDRWHSLLSAGRRCVAFFQQLAYALTHAARVETWCGGVWLARSEVTWRGTTATTWRAGAGREQVGLHRRALSLSLKSCHAWVRLTGHVLAGAGRVAVLLSLPGGALWAIPAVWRFVTGIVDDAKQFATVNIEAGHAG